MCPPTARCTVTKQAENKGVTYWSHPAVSARMWALVTEVSSRSSLIAATSGASPSSMPPYGTIQTAELCHLPGVSGMTV